jgi:hypothetical protein
MSFEFILPFLRPTEPFFAGPQTVLVRGRATPAAYESGHPKQFSHIHFVAHGTASRLSPFDSAIFMSKDADNSESFKLYTRKINNFHCTLTCHDFRLATAPASVSTLAKDLSAWHGFFSAPALTM